MRNWVKRITAIVLSALVSIAFITAFTTGRVNAINLGQRNLTLSTTLPSAVATHTITFNIPNDPSNTSLKSILLLYCTDPGPGIVNGRPSTTQGCLRPGGVDASAATLASQSGTTGFSIESQNTNELLLSDSASENLSGKTVQFVFNNVKNPAATTTPYSYGTFFVRIAAFQNVTATDPYTDYGAVASGTGGVTINTTVPPILDFCTGITIGVNCNTASGSFLQLGTLNTFTTAHAVSQFSIGTNAANGASVTVNGTTMASGNNTIQNLTSPTASLAGSSQFGLNLRANTVPVVGKDPYGDGTFSPSTKYGNPNLFMFKNGDVVASTNTSSNFQTFSVSYIVNINKNQPVGVYDTTITYICAANF